MKRRKEPTEFKLGTIVVPYIEMLDEAVAIRTEGVQLIIDTYFNDLSIDDIPQQYVFTWDWLGKGYKFTVINHLYMIASGCMYSLMNADRVSDFVSGVTRAFIRFSRCIIPTTGALSLWERPCE